MECLKWENEIDLAVADVCIQIIKEPLSYFSEADIQQLLVENLRKIKPLAKSYKTSVKKGKGAESKYSTSLLHREYGGGGGTRIDIVLFDPEDVQKLTGVNLTDGNNYLQPIYAFELGTEKSSDTARHVRSDLRKLIETTKTGGTGYLIHFYKDTTQSARGTISREKTEEKIENDFKRAFNNIDTKIENILEEIRGNIRVEKTVNIKILPILLRTYRNQKKMRGKCEIFYGHNWNQTNVSRNDDLKRAILGQLSTGNKIICLVPEKGN